MRRLTSFLWLIVLGLFLAVGFQALTVAERRDPEDLPWTPLDLAAPVGLFTAPKIAALATRPGACRAALDRAGIAFTPLPPLAGGGAGACGTADPVRLRGPTAPRAAMACPLAAGVAVWLREVVAPAAAEELGARVVATEDYGAYACRRVYGRAEGAWSEHARANAIDVSGFRLADGTRVTIARDWGRGPRGRFLARVRAGGCRLFSTVLSPDYNAAHRDHLHLDEAGRGAWGGRSCG